MGKLKKLGKKIWKGVKKVGSKIGRGFKKAFKEVGIAVSWEGNGKNSGYV